MNLAPGTRLGPYEILAPLGAGGMGEVYKARDTRLGRDVAIKALPPGFAQDPERLARFEREAKLLASLSHPNIAGIYGLEVVDEERYLVLEFVEGETLSDRLASGALPIDDAIDVARQIAAGVEAAHESGVIHRDLKPGNVMITPSGAVKVLDFGLARSGPTDKSGSNPNLTASPTVTFMGTQAGVVLGTAAYMSPEQARGKHLDRRTDIWSFGCVLYECLTGDHAFNGETVSDMVARILEREPDWSKLPSAMPARLRDLMERCMRKDATERLRDIGDARIVLNELSKGIGAGREAAGAAPARSRFPLVAAVAVTLLVVAASVIVTRMLSRPPAPTPLALSVTIPSGDRLNAGLENNVLAISPDGRSLVFAAQGKGTPRLFLRRLDDPVARELPGTDDARNPFFSPDGEWVAFCSGRSMKKVSVRGGMPVELTEVAADRAGTWLEDGTIVYSPTFGSPLFSMDANGGNSRAITSIDSTRNERTHRWPDALSGGEWVVFTVGVLNSPGGYDDASIDVVNVKSGERRTIAQGSCARAAPGNRLVFARSGSLYMIPLDPHDPRGGATPVPVLDGVRGIGTSGIAFFDIADDGTLALVAGRGAERGTRLAWADMNGTLTMIPGEPREYTKFSISPDGTRAVAQIGPGGGNVNDVYLVDLASGNVNQLTFGASASGVGWMPDGRHVVMGLRTPSGSTRIEVRDPLGTDSTRVLLETPGILLVTSVMPDGKNVVFSPYGAVDTDISMVSADGSRTVRAIVTGPSSQAGGVVSSDGRWIAYADDQSGVREVCVRPVDGRGGRVQVSAGGGNKPLWAPDASELYYISNNQLMATKLVSRGGLIFAGSTTPLFTVATSDMSDGSVTSIDVDPSGKKFLLLVGGEDAFDMRDISIRLNWTSTLDAKGSK